MPVLDFAQEIEIDETALDVEWLNQPRLFLKYARHSAHVKRLVDLAKEALEVERALLDRDIRSDPDSFDLTKVTETSITNTITAHPRYQAKMKEFIDAKHEQELTLAAVRAFEQRKVSLENLVRLHGMSYFAGPSVPRDLTEEKDMRNQRANQRVTIKRRK